MKTDRVPYDIWSREGWLTITDGARVDYEQVEADILKDIEEYDVYAMGFDPWNCENTRQRIDRESQCKSVKVSQSYRYLHEPCQYFEAAYAERQVYAGANPIIDWMVDNVEVQPDIAGHLMPSKPAHNARGKRIDGIAAMCNALAVAFQFDQGSSDAVAGVL